MVRNIRDLCRKEFDNLFDSTRLCIYDETKFNLLPQSIPGRAMSGQGVFLGNPIPDMTIQNAVDFLGFDSEEIKNYRQSLIDSFKDCIDNLLDGKTKYFVDNQNRPLFGIDFFGGLPLEVNKKMLKGAVIAGRMDTAEWRKKTIKYYLHWMNRKSMQMGYGKEYPINSGKLSDSKLTQKSLAQERHSPEVIEHYKKIGLISNSNGVDRKNLELVFIRHEKGYGISDDAALIAIGKNTEFQR